MVELGRNPRHGFMDPEPAMKDIYEQEIARLELRRKYAATDDAELR